VPVVRTDRDRYVDSVGLRTDKTRTVQAALKRAAGGVTAARLHDQVLDYVSRGEVDAGLVYATDALILRQRVRVAATVGGHAPIRYPAIVVADTRRRELALSFIEFLRSGPARERFAAAGFTAADR
jgi:ABC-type molybdate transport system substrate-binding protein